MELHELHACLMSISMIVCLGVYEWFQNGGKTGLVVALIGLCSLFAVVRTFLSDARRGGPSERPPSQP